ncbi:MAG: hypothetical protein J6P44_02960 [Bacteroidales bacterium]|nr:hypothetical protein [Bacteroidales bacterium]
MKKILLALGVISMIFIYGCGKKEMEEKLVNQKAVQDSVQAALDAKNNELEALFEQLNAIESDLDVVSSKYSDVATIKNTGGEINQDRRSKITSQIQDINEILTQNKQKISRLTSELQKSQSNNQQLTAFIEKLQARIAEQEEELQLMTTELQKKNITISVLNRNLEELTNQNREKDEHIMKVEDERNTVYYIIGTKDQLKQKGIISSTGGFLGMGKKTNLTSDSDLSAYTKIDARRIKHIILPGHKTQILTSHPSTSYELEGGADKATALNITDAGAFWAKSKFLVILVK